MISSAGDLRLIRGSMQSVQVRRRANRLPAATTGSSPMAGPGPTFDPSSEVSGLDSQIDELEARAKPLLEQIKVLRRRRRTLWRLRAALRYGLSVWRVRRCGFALFIRGRAEIARLPAKSLPKRGCRSAPSTAISAPSRSARPASGLQTAIPINPDQAIRGCHKQMALRRRQVVT